ncbi:MAG: hypothetical protein PSX36_06210 [bacterium]|nr:hypothetical protein [bacterium]
MKEIQENIKKFLNANRVASVCFNNDKDEPYCISCFFVYNEEQDTLIFKSSFGSSHDKVVQTTALVAGTVLPEKFDILKIRGIQFTGQILQANHPHVLAHTSMYYKKYPAGLVMPGYIWTVKLQYIKFTDNTLGFGNKTIWQANSQPAK